MTEGQQSISTFIYILPFIYYVKFGKFLFCVYQKAFPHSIHLDVLFPITRYLITELFFSIYLPFIVQDHT